MTLLLAIIAGLLYSYGHSWLFYCFCEGFSWLPLMHGIVYGAITGDLTNGIIIGASISTIYISLVAAGGNTPADAVAAGSIAIPIALMSHMDATSAVALGMTVAIIGNFLQPIQYNVNSIWVHNADRYAEQGNTRGIRRQVVWCVLSNALLRFPVAFCTVYFGTSVVDTIMNTLPTWTIHGLEVAGGILPALGIAMTLHIINKEKYFPFFILGYFLVVLSGMSILTAAIIGVSAAALILILKSEIQEES